MKVLVIGGTGYLGTAMVQRLQEQGHVAVVLVRDPVRAPEHVESRVGDLADHGALRAAVTPDIDAVVHAATPSGDWDADLAALDVLSRSLAGSTPARALLYLSGVWVLGAQDESADETATPCPIALVRGRPRLEERVRSAEGVRGIVIRPGIVHGRGGGIVKMMVDWARSGGVGRYVGDASVRWPMVHADDLADLVLIALERAEPGAALHAVTESAVPVHDLAAAADLAAGGAGRAVAWSEEDAAAELGPEFAGALALDQEVVAPAAHRLGWTPTRPAAVAELTGVAQPLTTA